jgi:hypothetical protein
MAKCNFSFDAVDGAASLLQKAKAAIKNVGGEINGDDSSGSFTLPTPLGTVKGDYTLTSASINLSITDKPMLVGCGMIESKLKEYLNQ